MTRRDLISIVVPVFNESHGISIFHKSLQNAMSDMPNLAYEIIYCDDGSTDNTAEVVTKFYRRNKNVKLVKLSRNFGKENALAAGIAQATGDAIIMLDGDGQHPPKLIKDFINEWRLGANVVIGVRKNTKTDGLVKKLGSVLFYNLFNRLTKQKLVPGSTDFRLIDRVVQKEFLTMKENGRITRGLIDWLGFRRKLVYFHALPRGAGRPGYSISKLIQLAGNSFVSLTPYPLYLFGIIGILITCSAFILGLAVLIEQILLNDPLSWDFTGTAMLGVLTLFLIGVVLLSQGILSLYISHIHTQSKQRPLYIVDHKSSLGLNGEVK